MRLLLALASTALLGATFGCAEYIREKEPLHANPNLDFQPKKTAQSLSKKPVKGTIPWGATTDENDPARKNYAQLDSLFYQGVDLSGNFVPSMPIKVDRALMLRGQNRFNLYCAVCHDKAGSGQSIVVKRGMVQPTDLADDRLVSMTDGELFSITTRGVRNMPAYRHQLSPKDRWAVIAYIRALQRARNAKQQGVRR